MSEREHMTDALTAALEYAERGWEVFPLHGKEPATAKGFYAGTADADEIRREFSKQGVTGVGWRIPDGYVVVDVDTRAGAEDLEASALRDYGVDVTKTLAFRTGSGGIAAVYKDPDGTVRQTQKLPGHYADTRVSGRGYIALPGSAHYKRLPDGTQEATGGTYSVITDLPLAEIPLVPEKVAQAFPRRDYGERGAAKLQEAMQSWVDPDGEPCAWLRKVADSYLDKFTDGSPRHGSARDAQYAIVGDAGKGHRGARTALEEVEASFLDSTGDQAYWDRTLRSVPLREDDFFSQLDRCICGKPEDSVDSGTGDLDDSRQAEIEREVAKLEIREEAKKLLRERKALAEWSSVRDDVPFKSLKDRLDEFDPEKEVEFVVEDLLATYGNVVFSAQDKAGKTTFSLALVKALADGGRYLNKFETKPIDRNICYMNVELAAHTADRWFADLGIQNAHKVQTLYLRGREQWFAIESPEVRQHVSQELRNRDIGVLIIDPIGPLWDAAGLDEDKNSEVGPYMVMLGQMAVTAGIDNVVVIQHAGHSTDGRARGASKILGWPDAVWSIRRVTEGSEERRYFKAYGRDIDVPEAPFTYDRDTREVTLMSADEVAARKSSSILDSITEAVQLEPGIRSGDLRKAISAAGADKTRWLDTALTDGLIHTHPGPQNSRLYFSGMTCPDGC